MTKNWYIKFIRQLIATYNQGQPYFVIKAHSKVCDLAGLFRKLGIVRRIKIKEFLDENEYNVFRIPKYIQGEFIIVWLQYLENEPYSQSELFTVLNAQVKKESEGHNIPFHKIVCTRKQSKINFSSKLTRKQMYTIYKPYINVIHIVETRGGLITSWEAIKRKQAGYILCSIYILWAIKHQSSHYVMDSQQIDIIKEQVQ